MSSRAITDLDQRLQPLCLYFINICNNLGIQILITTTYRSHAEQNEKYAQGRTTPGPIVTNARGGESPHNCTDENGNPASRAFDFGIKNVDGSLDWNADDTRWQTAIKVGIGLGLVSGSTFKKLRDSPHFELRGWMNA